MGTPGIPMSMGTQHHMTLHPCNSSLPWSRLRSDLTPPPLPGHPSLLLTAMSYSLDRGGMPALASTYTGSYRQLQLLIREFTKKLDSLIIEVLVSMGDIKTSYTVDCTDTISSYYGLFATLFPVCSPIRQLLVESPSCSLLQQEEHRSLHGDSDGLQAPPAR